MLILLGALMLSYTAIASNTISIRTLFEESDKYEGQRVAVTGEAIGDIMRDGETFWVNIKDGDFFIGVVLDEVLREKIRKTGRYKVYGDTVRISGVYHLHCKQHWGERDVHAETLDILQEGQEMEEFIDIKKVVMSVILAFATIIFIFYAHRRNVRKDNGGQRN